MPRSAYRRTSIAVACAALLGGAAGPAAGIDVRGARDVPFLVRAQTKQVKQPIRVAVQQAISALPPTTAQSFLYEETNDPFEPGRRVEFLGPISFRSPEVLGAGRFALRVATSYFHLSESLDPVTFVGTSEQLPGVSAATKLGLDLDATATIVSFSGTYGITSGIELSVNVPISIVSAEAQSIFTAIDSDRFPAFRDIPTALLFDDTPAADAARLLDDGLANGVFLFNRKDIGAVGGDFDEGTQVGLGRVGVTAKGVVFRRPWLVVSLSEDLALPSPSSDELAGTDSFGALTRVLVAAPLSSTVQLYTDAGYEFDTEFRELWRSVWSFGATVWLDPLLVDLGFGGSKYLEEIEWSPQRVENVSRDDGHVLHTTWVAQQPTGVGGTNYADFLAGFKIELTENAVLGGSVSVPVTDDGIRPDVTGTIALELPFSLDLPVL